MALQRDLVHRGGRHPLCAYNGKESRWYKAALRQEAGRITAAGITKEVTFENSRVFTGD
jgi:hypothetical protein